MDVLHIGSKQLFLQSEYPESENLFYPLYNENTEIIGTQFLINDFYIQLENFTPLEF